MLDYKNRRYGKNESRSCKRFEMAENSRAFDEAW